MKYRGSSNGSDDGNLKCSSGEACQKVTALSSSRLQRFENIWKALKAGTYNVDGRQVAEKMVSDAVRRLREQTR